ncbi:antimicrobial peptide ABC transporter permease protein [Ligilactobacillus salitolerans]|uniref:Antimicrobial peptide ABC transporter permease protein n=1 Tax=Ligilactobacillus salitolerans TaxID=1808352 RepID=A0A401IRW6_9LACO|nr:ABC transporter permease [Ligilactobacillus salitolerans]GBG94245.1 antimicrobial peptide ABC transporter permease protein [Ligilactobacillus salitolerans]
MKKTYLKSTFREIRFASGRFIAITLIIFMGVLLFVGVKSVGPDLTTSAQNEIEANNMSDLQVISTGGLTQADKKAVEKVTGVKAQLSKSLAYLEKKQGNNLQVASFSAKDRQNRLIVTKGHLPQSSGQVVIDQKLSASYSLGLTVNLKSRDLKKTRYQVVGYVKSPLYIANNERGTTTVGDGQVDGFAYLPEADFTTAAYTHMYLTFANLKGKTYSAQDYKKTLRQDMTRVEQVFERRRSERQSELQKIADQKSAPARRKLTDQQQKLDQGKRQLAQGKSELLQQEQQLNQQSEQLAAQVGEEQAQLQLASARQQIAQQKQQLDAQEQQLQSSQQKLTAGQKKLTKQTKVDKPMYLENKRSDLPGFNDYASLSDRIDAIANIFPVFFFLIAILITFTTMTRMITENRREIGTLLSLGYRKTEISIKYILYALLTVVIGGAAGVVVGAKLLPPVVFQLMGSMYIFTDYVSNYYGYLIWLSLCAALAATLGSAILVLMRDLREKPVELLAQKAPKAGKRIWLERLTPLWKKLTFTQKMTARNLLRYKSRMFLTIFGIAGCTGLMLAGFGLNDSIPAPGTKQYTEINQYQALVTLKAKAGTDQRKSVTKALNDDRQVTGELPLHSEQVTFRKKKASNQTATLSVVQHPAQLDRYISLNDAKTKEKQRVPQSGAIVSQRLAQAYGLHRGDKLHFEDEKGHEYTIKLAKLTENYVGHNVYLSADYYAQVTGKRPKINAYLVKTKQQTKHQQTELADKLTDTQAVLNTTYTRTLRAKLEKSVSGMNSVVLIFIVLSGTLAFVVLYNLTNINISERRRELATFKVLGFFDREVTMVIVRENIIFTLFGIVLGFAIGWLLNWFILAYASSNMMVFPVVIKWPGYVISAVMTLFFSAFVMFVTHRKLQNVDMIGALNASE